MRLYTVGTSYKEVLQPVTLTESPEDAAARFLVEDSQTADIKHLTPFGGGHSVCKGRAFAEREVLIFVAAFVATWEFEPVGAGWEIPGKAYNGTGTANPTGPVRVRVARRV